MDTLSQGGASPAIKQNSRKMFGIPCGRSERWEVECVCGESITSLAADFRCRRCGRLGRCEWPHVPATVPPDTTISSREEVA